MNKKFGAFSSSSNPEQLGDTVKGILIGLSSLIIFVASLMGVEIGSEQITEIAVVLGAAISAIWTAYGLIKKIVVKFIKK